MEHWVDYVIFALFLAISIGIGLYFSLTGGRQKTTEEFIMADRSLKVLPTTLSLLVSYQSAIMIIGFTAEVYVGGTNAWLQGLISLTVALLITTWIFVPWFYPLKLISVNRILELCFGSRDVRIFASVLSIISQVVYMGSATLAPSLALETATGFPASASIPIMAIVCIIYTALGGMKAVIWTDVFQAGIMLTGMLTILIKGLLVVGGFGEAFRLIATEGRLRWFTFDPDPTVRHTFWGYLIGNTVAWINTYAMTQASAQRICAVKSLKDAKLTTMLNCPTLWVMTSVSFMTGVVVVAYYIRLQCDPIESGIIANPNQLLPLFVKDVFKSAPGFGGLFLATLYSGALSSVSSCLSGASANTWDDILKWKLSNVSDYKASLINKALVVMYGLLACGLSFIIAKIPGPLTQVSISLWSSISGPVTGLFLLGSLKIFSRCTSKGALLGGILGFVCCAWLTIGGTTIQSQPLPHISVDNCTELVNATIPVYQKITGINHFYNLSYLWKNLFGCLVTMFGCVLFSYLIGAIQKKKERRDIPDHLFLKLIYKSESVPREDPAVEQGLIHKTTL